MLSSLLFPHTKLTSAVGIIGLWKARYFKKSGRAIKVETGTAWDSVGPVLAARH